MNNWSSFVQTADGWVEMTNEAIHYFSNYPSTSSPMVMIDSGPPMMNPFGPNYVANYRGKCQWCGNLVHDDGRGACVACGGPIKDGE